MVVYPDIQRKAQAAVEAAVGKDRLPEFDDILSIPYLHAVVKETLRWHPVAPLGSSTFSLIFGLWRRC